MGRAPSEVARWPADDVRLLDHYLAKQPAPIERVEIALAQFMAIYVSAHKPAGSKSVETADFLPFRDPWPVVVEPEPDYRAANKAFLRAMSNVSTRMRPK